MGHSLSLPRHLESMDTASSLGFRGPRWHFPNQPAIASPTLTPA